MVPYMHLPSCPRRWLLPYAFLIYLLGYSSFSKGQGMAQLTQTDKELYPVPVLALKAALQHRYFCVLLPYCSRAMLTSGLSFWVLLFQIHQG